MEVTDPFMIMALNESESILETTGYKRTDEEIQNRAKYYEELLS